MALKIDSKEIKIINENFTRTHNLSDNKKKSIFFLKASGTPQ